MTATPPSESSVSPNAALQDEVRDRVEALDKDRCNAWGGVWRDGGCHVQTLDLDVEYSDQTRVRSATDGYDAFKHYTAFFEWVRANHSPSSETVVLLPCGAQKPIGSSAIHQKKVNALRQAGLYPESDIMIVSEPCTLIPHEMRLSMPAVNYDFPPKFTDPDAAPTVFDLFTDRLATWLEETTYETIYAYLVSGHMEKLDAALEKASDAPAVVRVPGASLNPETMNYSGDQFKSVEDIATKLEFVRALSVEDNPQLVADYPDDVVEFYQNREEY